MIFMRLVKTDSENNRKLFYQALLYSMMLEIIVQVILFTVGLVKKDHAYNCEYNTSDRYDTKMMCSGWYRTCQIMLWAASIAF